MKETRRRCMFGLKFLYFTLIFKSRYVILSLQLFSCSTLHTVFHCLLALFFDGLKLAIHLISTLNVIYLSSLVCFKIFSISQTFSCFIVRCWCWMGEIPCRRALQLPLVFLPEESHRQRSLVGYSPQDCEEWNRTEVTQHTRMPIVTENISVIWGMG